MRRILSLCFLLIATLALLACDEHKVDRVGAPDDSSSSANASDSSTDSSPSAEAERTRSIEDRARAIAARAQKAQDAATTDQEKEDAVNQYMKDSQQLANDSQNGQPADQSSPPPQNP